MPYAIKGQVSSSPIQGGIEITVEQYQQAIAGMLQGKVVSIENGFALVDAPAPVEPAPTPTATTIFSTLDYFAKFTDAEYQAARTGPISIQRGLDMLIAAQYVDIADPRVANYLSAMVTAGIITDARKAELLAPPAAS